MRPSHHPAAGARDDAGRPVVGKREEKRRDRIRVGTPFDERAKDADGRRRVAPKQGNNAVSGSRLCSCVRGDYKNASGQQRGQSHTRFDA